MDSEENAPWSITFMKPKLSMENISDGSKPNFLSEDCRRMREKTLLCRDLRKGTVHMLKNASRYLPQYEGEYEQDYKDRLKFAVLWNFYEEAANKMVGKIFAKLPMLNDDVPEEIREDLKDANLNGDDWTVLAKSWMSNAIDEGMAWMLVDYHSVPEALSGELTLAQERELGVRPYCVVIPQCNVLGVQYTKRGAVNTIQMFRYQTLVRVPDGAYGEKWVWQVRVVTPDLVEMFEKDDNGDWVLKDSVPSTLGMVAAVPLNLKKTGPFSADPPLENLANLNLEHFQIRSDQRRALSVASYPLLALFGVAPDTKISIGPLNSYSFEDPKANMKWIESQGVHLTAGDRELRRLEDQIRVFGLAFENPGMYATATGRSLDASDAVAPIIWWAYAFRDAMNMVLHFFAKWRKLPSGGTVNVDVSFIQNMLTIEALKLLVEALKEGAITIETFLARMKDYGILPAEFSPSEEATKLEEIAKQAVEDAMKKLSAETLPPDNSDVPQ